MKTSFKSGFSLPIVMSDRHKIMDLEETLSSFDNTSIEYSELEDYIGHLKSIERDFLFNISNNLRLQGMGEGVLALAGGIIDRVTVLAPPSTEYNCHGWSFGTVINISLSCTNEDLPKEMYVLRKLKAYSANIDERMSTFFSLSQSSLREKDGPSAQEGSIVVYQGNNQNITHTAKYIQRIKWYTYEDEYYKEWYDKDRVAIKFDTKEDGNINDCIVEGYTSKLGLGHLVVHNIGDIIPLYGEVGGFFDLV
jgi:hypothetical protein